MYMDTNILEIKSVRGKVHEYFSMTFIILQKKK